jgi:hypothetical protein
MLNTFDYHIIVARSNTGAEMLVGQLVRDSRPSKSDLSYHEPATILLRSTKLILLLLRDYTALGHTNQRLTMWVSEPDVVSPRTGRCERVDAKDMPYQDPGK